MLRTKKDVDKHVSGILARIKDEKEKHMRGFNFARLYYSVKDYDSARRHLAAYLSVNEKHSAAHKLMGQIYEATGNQEQALQSYKRSLTLEENQKDVVLKICDIYCNLPVDPETAKYWLERAQNLFPGDAVIFKLKEGMAKAGGGTNTKDLENLITSELLTRPNDVALRVKLLRLLLNSGRVQEAHKHALQAEEQPDFRLRASRSLDWLHCLADVFEAYQEQGTAAVDHHFLTKYLLTLDQLAELSMSSSSASTSGSSTADCASNRTEEGAIAAVRALDCLLEKAHQQRWTRTGAWAFALQQASAQLYLHMASLLLKRTWKEGGNWQEASQWASALLLTSYAHRPPDNLHQGGWFLQMEQGQQETLRVVFLRALHRMSVSGHLVTTLCEEDKSRWLARIKGDVCTVQVRERIFQSLLGGERGPSVSWFLNDAAFLKSSLEFPTPSALRDYDKESQLLYPDSLNHLVWLALQHNGAADKKARTPESHFEVRVFASLQRETLNQRGGTPESLSQMDTDAFVEATRWCAAQALSQGRRIPGPLSLPPHVGVPLCTQAQAGWWSAAHQLHTNSAGEQLPELRRVLQRGLEVIRGIGNHGLDLPLVVHLARTFAVKSSSKREQCQDEDVCLSLEGRAALYWQLALSLLEAGSGPFASPRGPSRRLFGPSPLTTPLSSAEERALREEACMFLAVRAMNAECLEEAAEMLADLRSAEAALYTALVLKRLSQQKAGDPGMQQALLTRARNSLLLSLERGQREALNQDLTLQVRQQLEDLEALLAEANLSNGSLEEQVGSPRRGLSTSQFRNSTQSSSTPRPDRRFFETRTEADMTNMGSESVTDTPPRSRTRQAARDAAGSYGTDLTEVMLRSLSLHQDIVVRSLGQMQETNRQILTEMREIGKAMATEAKQRETLMEQLVKKLEDATTRATAARSQRHREDSEYVDDYVGNYEAEYDAYADYSHPEAGGGASPLVAAPAPLPLGYPPYRGQPYGGFPAAPLGYPLVPPPPPMGRPLAPPPPQAFYSPQAAAAAAAVATPGLRLAEGQPLPHFTFDISQPPPPPVPSMMPAGRLPAPPVPPPSAFSRLGPLPPPPAPTLTPPKPPNAPHAFQIPLPPTASAGQSPSFLGSAATAATAPAPAPASTTPQLEGLLRKGPAGGPSPASLVPEKQAPTTPVGSKTGEAATPSPGVARRGSQRLSTGSDDYLEEAEVEGNFKPLIPLPEEVSVCTGEENEKVLFEERAKLFRFVDKEWKERGIGVLKLLENQEGKVRLLMRREQVLKVCANHNMHPSMTLTPMPNKDTAWIWDAQDFADGEPRPEKFCVRFKTPEIASRFKDAFEQAVQKSKRPRAPSSSSSVSGGGAISSPSPAAAAFSPPFSAGASFGSPKSTFGSVMAASAVSALSFGSPVAATVVASGSPPTSLPSLPATGFGKMFHPKPGAWSCHVCYVSNEANKLTCAACDSPKPDYVSNEASKPTGSTTDSQQPGAGKPKTTLVQASGTKPGTSLFGEIAASKTPTASPAWTTFGAIATSKASSAPPGQSVFGAIATSKALPTSPAQSVSGDVAAGKALPASPALSVFGAIATSKASSAVPAQSVFGDVATSKASPTPPAQSVFGAIATSKASSAVPAHSVFGDVTTSKASPTPPAQSVFGQIATSQASTASPSSSVFGDVAKSKASSCATAPSLFGGCATTKVPPTVATSAHVFTFGVTMPDQKPAASASPFGGSSSGANVFGGFTFSSPPKVKEAPKEESKATPAAATTKGEAAKPSPFASFSFQSPTKKEEPKEAAASPFVVGARSEISKLSLTPPAAPSAVSLPNLAKSALGKAAPPAPAKTPRSPQEVPEEFVPNVEFEPVVPLPELVEAKTGEEDEEVLFCQRAKLYRYDGETKQWKERGVGQLKILRHGETGACRVLMRRDQVLKLCANHRILPEMKLGPLATGDRAWSWFAKDYSEGELNSEQLAVRFKTRELAEQFRQVFESCRDEAVQVVPAKAEVAQEAETEESVQQQSVPLSQLSQFRPKQGTWSCETCYVENPTERVVCVACETPRPGAAQPGPGAPSPLAALEKFASPVVGNTGFPVGPSATTPAKFSFGFPSAGAATASSQGGASSKAPGFVFGCGTQQFGGSAPPSTFTFGAAVSSANAPSSSEESSQAPGAFKFGSPQKYEFSFSGVRPRSPGKTPKSPGTPTDAEEEDAGGWTESPEADIYFQPVVPLPPKVAVKTGEEEEELLYSHRAKLYRWLDGEWKERGLGDIKLLFDPAAKRVRLLMRREPVLKVCLNHLLSRELQLTKKDDKVVLWSATDFSDGEPSPHQFALRLKTPQLADEFLAAVEAAKARLDAPPESAAMAASKPASRVDASTFSFRLDDTPKEAASPATPPAAAASFSLASRFGGSRQSVVRSLFGNTSPAKTDSDDAVELVFEAKATEAQVARARELLLPDNFFLYETRPPCPGCRGCDDWDTKKKAGQSATPPAAAAPRRTAAVEKEPANVAAADSTTDEGSLFSSSSVMQFSFAELAQQGASGFGKPAGSPPKSSIPLLAGAGSKLFQSASRHKSEADDDGEEEVAPSSEVHFEPVVPLPDLVELKTGEEEEEALFCSRAKLYVFHADLKQWKERAIGDIKILKHKHRPCCFRVLMRRDQVHKIACNHAITGFIRLAPLSTSANSLTWNAIDYTDGKPSPESFAVRFKNAEILDAFAKTFEECRLAVLEKENIGGSEEAVSGRNGEQEKSEQESTEKEEEDEEEEEEEEEDEEDEEDDDDHGEDVMFEKRVTLAVLSPSGDSYQMVGMGNLRMVYDDSCYGARIRVLSDDAAEGGGVPLCDTIVAVQTCLRTERLHAFWSAVDMSRNPHERRHFRVTFSSPQAVQEFDRAFTEGKELALSSSIVETIDEPPSHPK